MKKLQIKLNAEDLKKKLRLKDGIDGRQGIAGPMGKTGKTGDKGLRGEKGDRGKEGRQGPEGEKGKDGSPDTGKQIVSKINILPIKKEYQIGKEHIYGLDDEFSKFAQRFAGLGSPAGALRMDGLNNPMANISWGGYKITNLGTPTDDADASTKKYVDDAVAVENLWDRAGTTLSPHTAGDDINTAGDLTVTNAKINGDLTLKANNKIYLDG